MEYFSRPIRFSLYSGCLYKKHSNSSWLVIASIVPIGTLIILFIDVSLVMMLIEKEGSVGGDIGHDYEPIQQSHIVLS